MAYDANGNRTAAGSTVADNNEVTSDGTYNYTCDAEGNRTSRTNLATGLTENYYWDYRNRLIGVQAVDSNSSIVWTVQYTYDVDNQLISRTLTQGSSTTTEHFGWIDGQMVFRTDANGMILDHYTWVSARPRTSCGM